ncbi:DUF2490 domain-containing protein [Hymenobacter tibetensis]|uniref:DUF2490 domain-containing protein n=1 Tax=Hymenobacter tibetensis TaxID=497967 RepID=A0ABY4CYU2_9BACT|nr:DUF2490 domain-containing protein [Hymenobacter tibetensis]UOG74144.1 DUF2490 domain-containing protein [Hymenobacter tibetensis]
MKSIVHSTAAKLLVLLLLSLASGAQAQTQTTTATPTAYQRFNTWLMVFSDARLSNKWGIHTEGQLRQVKGPNSPQQKFLRVGANYYVANILVLTGGYANTMSYPDGNDSDVGGLPEHRSYQQVLLRFDSSRVMSQHRYRLEQRWVQHLGDKKFTYLNRFRYQLRLTLPLNHERKIAPGTPYVLASNELFVVFGRNDAGKFFEQNRACLGVGYQVNRATSIEAGYMNQMSQQETMSSLVAGHILHLGLNFNPDFRKGKLTMANN